MPRPCPISIFRRWFTTSRSNNMQRPQANRVSEANLRRPLFLPTARQTNWLLIVAFLSVGEALYIRYMAIENLNMELACQAGLNTWLCSTFRLSIILFNHQVFGGAALVAALLNLLRPSVVLARFRSRRPASASCCITPTSRRLPQDF